MKEKISDFFRILLLCAIGAIVYLGVCGGLMFLVSHTIEGFLAGVLVGFIFGIGLFAYMAFATIHTFIQIFR